MAKIFISYTARDRKWADWIGVTLRDNGHVPFVHEWEIGPGGNIPRWMDERIKAADCLLAVFTDAYAGALYSSTERWAAYWSDPAGREGFLVPVEVEKVSDWPPLTRPLKRLSLVGLSGVEAEIALLKFLEPAKPPAERPAFPGEPPKPSAGTLGGTGDGAAFTHLSAPLPAQRPPLPTSPILIALPSTAPGAAKRPSEVRMGALRVLAIHIAVFIVGFGCSILIAFKLHDAISTEQVWFVFVILFAIYVGIFTLVQLRPKAGSQRTEE